MSKFILWTSLILLFLADIALASTLAVGGYYVFGYPIGTMDKTEEAIGSEVRTYNLDNGVKLRYGSTNFGAGFKYSFSDMIGIGVEGSAEYHMGYLNEACTITGTTEYQGQSDEYTENINADEIEQQSIFLNVGANYTIPLLGIFRPFFGCGFTYAINTIYELDEELERTGTFDKGNSPGFYAQGGLELATALNYSVYVPIKYTHFLGASYERQYDEGSFDPSNSVSEYRMRASPMLSIGIGIYYIPF